MNTATDFSVRGKRVTVAGAARSGIAAAQLLARRGALVTISDSRPSLEDSVALEPLGIRLELGGHHPRSFTNAELIVVSPGIPWRLPLLEAARGAGVEVIGELELASRWLRGRIVAITGTKGKSTTTTLVGKMLAAGQRPVLVGGNIGVALSAQVEASTEDTVHVVEASSFQLEASDTFHPWIAVLLNFSPDHLDRHGTVEAYGAAKSRIFLRQGPTDWAVLNADDPASLALSAGATAQRVLFSTERVLPEGVFVRGGAVVRRRGAVTEPLLPLDVVRVPGRHLLADIVAAAAVADLAGIAPQAIASAVAGFGGLEHALEIVAEVGGVRFVNDSKATNIESAQRAIESFGAGLVVILGGRFKGGDFRDLAGPLRARGASVVAIGESRGAVMEALSGTVLVREAADLGAAVRLAFGSAPPGGVVLLAPACASFDMFHDYAERGRVFKQEVSRLQEEWRDSRNQ